MDKMHDYLKKQLEYEFKISAVGGKERFEGPIDPAIQDTIISAIENRWNLFIQYQNADDIKKVSASTYKIQPYILGLNKFTHNTILRAYVLSGGLLDGFVTFRLDRIKGCIPIKGSTFDTPADGYFGPHDDLMGQLITVIKFPE